MNSITAEVTEAIQRHLPATVSTVLQQRLALVDTLEKQLAQSQIETKSAHALATNRGEELTKHGLLAERERQVVAREAAVTKRENAIELNEFKVKAAEDKASAVVGVVHAVFANNRLKYREHGTAVAGAAGSGSNCSGYVASAPYEKNVESEG